jgi:osmoprotectant transport system ATP-binding protein
MIQFDHVGKDYPDGTTAVGDLSFSVPSHRTVALIGPSGAGKTTLLRMVNRMVDPSRGRVLIDDVDVRTTNPVTLRRSIGYVLQAGGLMPHRTVLENVTAVPMLKGVSGKAARLRAAEYLELVGLDPAFGNRYPSQLSGGQQQRVGVARALAGEPNILLMDEPFGAVDPIVRRELQAELRRIQAELGKTIVLVTHDVDEALALADEIVVLGTGGRLAQRATPAELISAPADDFVADFIGVNDPSRQLRVQTTGSTSLVTDGSGRPIGILRP